MQEVTLAWEWLASKPGGINILIALTCDMETGDECWYDGPLGVCVDFSLMFPKINKFHPMF